MSASDDNKRVRVPAQVRYELWIAAGARCEFAGCNRPLDRDFLTQQDRCEGVYAHIVADSPKGPRGNAKSKELAHDPANLMLLCRDCHARVDHQSNLGDFPDDVLRGMKLKHEERIRRLLAIDATERSVPVIVTFPIRGHRPSITIKEAQRALMLNSDYSLVPADESIVVDRNDFPFEDDVPDYWTHVQAELPRVLNRKMEMLRGGRNSPTHFSVFALAPMPVLLLLGRHLGDKGGFAVYQRHRARSSWEWASKDPHSAVRVSATLPEGAATSVAVLLSLSGRVDERAVNEAAPGIPIARFEVHVPDHDLIQSQADLAVVSNEARRFLSSLRDSGVKRIELFPAAPASVCVELGRMLRPKADPCIQVWDYQNGQFVSAIELN